MRDDLLDAQAAVDWAVSYSEILRESFVRWQKTQPYRLVVEADPKSADKFLVAYPEKPLDPMIFAGIRAVLNSIRTALDLLAAVLSIRSGVQPDNRTHFPIHLRKAEFLDDLRRIEGKERVSKRDAAKIKTLRPYERGDDVFYRLHRLDVIRKHHRFLSVSPKVAGGHIIGSEPGITPWLLHSDDKTVLYRISQEVSFRPHQSNTLVAAEILINEAALTIKDEPAIPLVRRYARRVSEAIALFDAP